MFQIAQDRIINLNQVIEAKYKAAETGNSKAPAELALTLAHNGRTETLRGTDAEQAWEGLQRVAGAMAGLPLGLRNAVAEPGRNAAEPGAKGRTSGASGG
jgi:hypothetical protein